MNPATELLATKADVTRVDDETKELCLRVRIAMMQNDSLAGTKRYESSADLTARVKRACEEAGIPYESNTLTQADLFQLQWRQLNGWAPYPGAS